MSKVGQWVFEMQEAAPHMSREEFIEQYGERQVDIWDQENIHFEDVDPNELLHEAMAEGFYGS